MCETAGVVIVDEMHLRRPYPDAQFFIGAGNAAEAYLRVQDAGANMVIAGCDLSPTQQRNLENAVMVRVVDRTQLILDIFAQRARTAEGKLQVELAQLEYLLPRLTGRGTEMSRIGGTSAGGIATRGPGETKLETDRRVVRKRIGILRRELQHVVQHRAVQTKSRRELLVPSVALVGYTSAGKSTLLNLLAGTDILADARLFATLDPTTRRVELEHGHSILLSDTVGFLRRLPHSLIAAFKATLEEVVEADFLIHVIDASHTHMERQREAVLEVLEELGVSRKPVITVFNKCDLVRDHYELRRLIADTPDSCYMSARTGDGVVYLYRLIEAMVARLHRRLTVILPYERGDLLAVCHDRGRVIEVRYTPDGVRVEVELAPDLAFKLREYEVDHSDEEQ